MIERHRRSQRQTKAAGIWLCRRFGVRGNKPRNKIAWTAATKIYHELDPLCNASACEKPAVKRIACDVYGVMYEVDVCMEHSHFDNQQCDAFF